MRVSDRYEVIVAGGGLAGCAAAICASRLGARTLLVERYGFLGGCSTAGLVNPFMSTTTSDGKPLVGGLYKELCNRLAADDAMLGNAFDPEAMKYWLQEMVLESGADLLLHSWVTSVRLANGNVVGVGVCTKSGVRQVGSVTVVDATGDADVAAMSGVPFETGGVEHGLPQAMTLMLTIGSVDLRKALRYAKDNPDQMRFPRPTSEAEIESMLESAVGVAGFYREVELARETGEFPLPQDMIFFISLPTPGYVVLNTTHIGGLNGTSSEDLTEAEIEGRRQAVALVKFLRKYIPGFERAYLAQTATQVGVRESRRIVGEYVFGLEDVLAGRKFHDAILRSAYPVDIHSPTGKGYAKEEDHAEPLGPPPGDWYEAPYRSLVPKCTDGLLIAGRCISSTHEGQAALRIMPNCVALGQAAGTAAALCVRNRVTPRAIDTDELRQCLLSQGGIV